MHVDGLVLMWCVGLLACGLGWALVPLGRRGFVWVLLMAASVPLLLAYKWLCAPVLSWVDG